MKTIKVLTILSMKMYIPVNLMFFVLSMQNERQHDSEGMKESETELWVHILSVLCSLSLVIKIISSVVTPCKNINCFGQKRKNQKILTCFKMEVYEKSFRPPL